MRLVLKERKKLLEQVKESDLLVTMRPADFIKATTYGTAYDRINTFVQTWHSMSEKDKKNVLFNTSEDRSTTVSERQKYFPGNTDSLESDSQVSRLLIGALAFIQPHFGTIGHGKYDEEKSGTRALTIAAEEDLLRVLNHEGRTRTTYSWLVGEKRVRVLLHFTNSNFSTINELPYKMIPQFESRHTIITQPSSPSDETMGFKEASTGGGDYKTVQGFMNEFDKLRYSAKSGTVDSLIQDYNTKNLIKVNGEEAIVFKAISVSDGGDLGMYVYGLYPKRVNDITREEGTEGKIKYWKQVRDIKFALSDGPVTVENK